MPKIRMETAKIPVRIVPGNGAKLLGSDGEVFERAARDGAVFMHLAVLDAEGALREFRSHAQQAGQDHLERRAGTAVRHGRTHAGNISEAHGPGECRGTSLKMGHLSGIVLGRIAAANHFIGDFQAAELDEP